MFDKFGEFDSAEELNKAAEGLKAEGDLESLKALAIENGLDEMDAEDYANGDMPQLATVLTAALGKLAIEKADVRCEGIILDWLGYIESEAAEDEAFAKAVRAKGVSLIGCLGELLKVSFRARYKIDDRIIKASGITGCQRVEMGMPGMQEAKDVIRGYYL